jgi:hypothetical protein
MEGRPLRLSYWAMAQFVTAGEVEFDGQIWSRTVTS